MSRRWVVVVLAGAVLALGVQVWWQWPQGYLRRGQQALTARDYATAREQLGRYLAHRPNDAAARLLAARAARRSHEYYEAHDHLNRCRADARLREAAEVEIALIGVQRGDDPSAALRLRSEEDDDLALVILEVLIQHDLDTYRLRQAQVDLARYLERRPDDLHALLARGYVWERLLRFADAVDDYRAAVVAHPDSEQARLKLAETLLIAGTPSEALEHFERLAAKWQEKRAVRFGLAQCHRRLGDADAAQRQLDALLAESPEDGEALWERGQIDLGRKRPADAEAYLRKAARVSPYDRRIAYSLAVCLQTQGKRAEAEKIHQRVADLDADLKRLAQVRQEVMDRPTDPAPRCEGGLLFLRNGEREEGVRWLRLALKLDPACRPAREALDRVEAERR